MSHKKQVDSTENGTERRVKVSPPQKIWFCCHCGHGPHNVRLNECCVECGRWWCESCNFYKLDGQEESVHNMSSACHAAPLVTISDEALHMATSHAHHNVNDRAATPYINGWGTVSNVELLSPPAAPYQTEQGHLTDIGTYATAYSAVPSIQVASEPWNVGEYGTCFASFPAHESFHDSSPSAYTDLPSTNSLVWLDTIHELAAQIPPDWAVDHFIQHTTGNPGFTTSVEPSTFNITPSNVAVHTYTSNSELRTISVPHDGLITDVAFSGLSEFSIGATAEPPMDPPSVFDDANNAPLSPQLLLVGSDFPEPPLPVAQSLNAPESPNKGTIEKVASKHCKYCKHGDSQRLACCFYKHDPEIHKGCMSKHFGNFSHLGQHLRKSHSGPASFSKRRRDEVSTREKWNWCFKKLFGEEADLPDCPFFHSTEDLEPQC